MAFSVFGSDPKTSTAIAPPQLNPQQAPFLTGGWNAAQSLFNQQKDTPYFAGPTYAGLNQMQTSGANQLAAYANSPGAALGEAASTAAQSNLGAGSLFGSNAMDLYRKSLADPTQGIISNASQYANSPYAQSMVDAASRDVTRNLQENELTGIQSGAIDAGGLNSSRAGAAEAIAQRGAADRIADTSANIRGDLFNQGLQMSQNQHNQNFANASGANSQLGAAFTNGMQGAATAQGINFGNADAITRAGSMFQADQQGQMDDKFTNWQNSMNMPWNTLGNYMGVIGGGNPISGGIQTSSTSAGKQSGIGTALGVASALKGLWAKDHTW